MCKIKRTIFNKYWQILKRNYNDTQHTTQDADTYYSIFKDFTEKDFTIAVKKSLMNCKYFPNIYEINQFIPRADRFEKWERIEKEEMNEEELKEMEKLLKPFKTED